METIIDLSELRFSKHGGKWKYRLTSPLVRQFFLPWAQRGKTYEFWQIGRTKDQLLGVLYGDGRFVIEVDYASDGATCAPDFGAILPEVFFHDIMCQFALVWHSPFSRWDADHAFFLGMKRRRFLLRHLYFAGVRLGAAMPSSKEERERLFIIVR